MPIISRKNESTGWRRTTGIWGHWPRYGLKSGYIAVLTSKHRYNFNYFGNPYRPGKVLERFNRRDNGIQ